MPTERLSEITTISYGVEVELTDKECIIEVIDKEGEDIISKDSIRLDLSESKRLQVFLNKWLADANFFPGLQVWVYSGGEIVKRTIEKIDKNKVYYTQPDDLGYIGAKRSSVYFTYEQAELARNEDISDIDNDN